MSQVETDQPGGDGYQRTGGCSARRINGTCNREPLVARGLCLACTVNRIVVLREHKQDLEEKLKTTTAELEDLCAIALENSELRKLVGLRS